MNRRYFLSAPMVAGASLVLPATGQGSEFATKPSPFHLKFAPHFGMFASLAGKDLVDQLKFAADQGFAAWEDNGMKGRSIDAQKQIARAMQQLNIEMGTIGGLRGVWNDITFAGRNKAVREKMLKAIQEAVDVGKRVNAKFMTVVPGLSDPKLPEPYQTVNCIELLKRCCDIVEPAGMTMVIEPLNHWADHPGLFLHGSPQAFLICKAVNRPGCKILFDLYHQQITEGNLMVNIDRCWDEIGYFQCGDNPGRKEPGTGEINYTNVFRHIAQKGFKGIVGMEHGNSQPGADGERAVIAAYRKVDPAPDSK